MLVDKPFANHASVLRMAEAAKAAALLFMDATHFVHHPRTLEIKKATAEKIGTPRSLHTAFYFPFSDRTNIRFDPKQEPMTALGDMAWYSMRAVVEYLRPAGKIIKVAAVPERDTVTNAIIRVAGMIAFEDGKISTFDVGYTAGTIVMDLELFGTTGVISMDDFVLDWTESFAFKNPDIQTGYTHRTGMATRKDAVFIPTQNQAPQQRGMVEHFALEAMNGTPKYRAAYAAAALQTQEYVDALWAAATS